MHTEFFEVLWWSQWWISCPYPQRNHRHKYRNTLNGETNCNRRTGGRCMEDTYLGLTLKSDLGFKRWRDRIRLDDNLSQSIRACGVLSNQSVNGKGKEVSKVRSRKAKSAQWRPTLQGLGCGKSDGFMDLGCLRSRVKT